MAENVQLPEIHLHAKYEISTFTGSKAIACVSFIQDMTFGLEG